MLGDLGPGDEAPFAGNQQDQQLHRLALDAQRTAVAPQLKAAAVKLEVAELEYRTGQDAGQGILPRAGRCLSMSRKSLVRKRLEVYQNFTLGFTPCSLRCPGNWRLSSASAGNGISRNRACPLTGPGVGVPFRKPAPVLQRTFFRECLIARPRRKRT